MTPEDLYARLREFVGKYNRTQLQNDELAVMLWMEFMEGGYEQVAKSFVGAEGPFMRSFVRKRCLREWTIQVRRGMREVHGEVMDWLRSGAPAPDEALEQEDQKRRAALALVQIGQLHDERERKTATMLMDGATYREIQIALGCSLGTVHNIVCRLKNRAPVKELRKVICGRE